MLVSRVLILLCLLHIGFTRNIVGSIQNNNIDKGHSTAQLQEYTTLCISRATASLPSRREADGNDGSEKSRRGLHTCNSHFYESQPSGICVHFSCDLRRPKCPCRNRAHARPCLGVTIFSPPFTLFNLYIYHDIYRRCRYIKNFTENQKYRSFLT